jgi:hypothetical protein
LRLPVRLDRLAALPDVFKLRLRASLAIVAAAAVFLASLLYYILCLFPGLGGELNAGDSAKFQVLGHTPILLHGPGYPIVLMLGAGLRMLALPFPEWWTLTVALSAVPAAIANTIAFLIVDRLTRNLAVAVAAALLLASAGLMAVQATEAEVYALTLAFVLGTAFLLVLFVETNRLGFFLAACAVYAFSFGNHLMMIMLLPVFLLLTVVHRNLILRPLPVALILLFIALGASQYAYLAYVAYSAETAYSEYMPLPPEPMELVHYVLGTYFRDLYGSGLASTRTLEALIGTLRSAHPWISLPMIGVGAVLFVASWSRRDANWYGVAVVYGVATAFIPFVLWYGAYDIWAFHLPVLGPLLVAAVATLGWWLRPRPGLLKVLAALLLAVGLVRTGQTGIVLAQRQPIFTELESTIETIVAQSSVEKPLVAMSYALRMATLYHVLRGDLPRSPVYRVWWRAVSEIGDRAAVGGIVVPTDGYQFVRWIEYHRPDMACRSEKIALPEGARWPAYAFECRGYPSEPSGKVAGSIGAPEVANPR